MGLLRGRVKNVPRAVWNVSWCLKAGESPWKREWLLMRASLAANEAMTLCLKVPSLSRWGSGQRRRMCARPDLRRPYVNNFHFPSAAAGITHHGRVVMVTANGQRMGQWVRLVMNLRPADGCLTGVHFFSSNRSQRGTPEGPTLPLVRCSWRFLISTGVCCDSSRCKVAVLCLSQIRSNKHVEVKKSQGETRRFQVESDLFLTSCPLVLCPQPGRFVPRLLNERGYRERALTLALLWVKPPKQRLP